MKFTVRSKLITFILIITTLSTLTLFFYSKGQFTEQIDAYTRENTLVPIRSSRPYVLNLLSNNNNNLTQLSKLTGEESKQIIPQLLKDDLYSVAYGFANLGFENPTYGYNEGFFGTFTDDPKKTIEQLIASFKNKIPKLEDLEFDLINISQANCFCGAIAYRKDLKVFYSIIRFDNLLDSLKSFQKNPIVLLDKRGNVIFHTQREKMISSENLSSIDLFKKGSDPKSANIASFDFNFKDILMTGSYAKLGVMDLVLISYTSKIEAYLPISRYVRILTLSAVILILLSIIFAIFFSNAITNPLKDMTSATTEIRKGNYGVVIEANTNDELRDLAEGFNLMSSEITKLMEETAKKAALDKELETASAVQNTLIPGESYKEPGFEIGAKYIPAALCGGDWWSFTKLVDGRTVLLIADATGHGVGSALVTAAANSAVSTISYIARREGLVLSSDVILEEINFAIYEASKGQILMTFFVAIIDSKNSLITYSNASHNVPYLIKTSLLKDTKDKKNIKALTGAAGDICGLRKDSVYTVDKITYDKGDFLLLYTDGLIECENKGKEQYGKKRLFKVLLENAHCEASVISEKIYREATDFFGDEEHKDDISLVVTKFL